MRTTTKAIGLLLAVVLVVLVIGFIADRNPARPPILRLVVVGSSNVAGRPGLSFRIDRDGGGRVLTCEGCYLMGKEHLKPSEGWHCKIDSAIRARLRSTNHLWVPRASLAKFSDGAPSGTEFWMPAPTNCSVWRLGLNVNPEMRSPIARMKLRLRLAWGSKELSYLTGWGYFGTDSTWVESCLITNAQPGAASRDGPPTPVVEPEGAAGDRDR